MEPGRLHRPCYAGRSTLGLPRRSACLAHVPAPEASVDAVCRFGLELAPVLALSQLASDASGSQLGPAVLFASRQGVLQREPSTLISRLQPSGAATTQLPPKNAAAPLLDLPLSANRTASAEIRPAADAAVAAPENRIRAVRLTTNNTRLAVETAARMPPATQPLLPARALLLPAAAQVAAAMPTDRWRACSVQDMASIVLHEGQPCRDLLLVSQLASVHGRGSSDGPQLASASSVRLASRVNPGAAWALHSRTGGTARGSLLLCVQRATDPGLPAAGAASEAPAPISVASRAAAAGSASALAPLVAAALNDARACRAFPPTLRLSAQRIQDRLAVLRSASSASSPANDRMAGASARGVGWIPLSAKHCVAGCAMRVAQRNPTYTLHLTARSPFPTHPFLCRPRGRCCSCGERAAGSAAGRHSRPGSAAALGRVPGGSGAAAGSAAGAARS